MGKKALVARNAAIGQEAKAILDAVSEENPLTDEQRATLDKLDTELRENEAAIAKLDEDEKRAARFADSISRYKDVQVGVVKEDPHDINLRTATGTELVSRARTVLEKDKLGTEHLRDEQRAQVERILRTKNGDTDGSDVARLLLATENEHYRSAFPKLIAGRPDFSSDEVRAIQQVDMAQRAMAIGATGTGGFAVPVLIDPTIIWTAQGSPNDIINLARVERITNDKWRGLTSQGMTWGFKAEGAPSTDNSPTIAQPSVSTFRADGFIPYSLEVEMDWPSFASDMSTAMESGYAELLASTLSTGSGVGQPNGIKTALNAQAGSKVQVATSAVLVAADVYKLWKSLPIKWRRRDTVAWMAHTGIEQLIRQFGAGASADANFTVNMNSEKINPLFQRSFYENDFLNDMPTAVGTELLLYLGDWKQYLVAQRMGMTVERLQMLFDPATGNPTGKRGMVGYARVGADLLVPDAFRVLVNK